MNPKGPLVLAGVSLALFVVGAFLLWRQIAFGRRAVRAEGVVVDWRHRSIKDRPDTYEPVVEYRVDGLPRRFRAASPADDWPKRQGEKLPILYDPAAPDVVELDEGGRFVPSIAWMLLGVAVGLAAFFVRKR